MKIKDIVTRVIANHIVPNRSQEDVIRYLEIGVNDGRTIKAIPNKISGIKLEKEGVDPYGAYNDGEVHRMTSQMFFAVNKHFLKKRYDVIFIDACHFSEIVDQEIQQSLKILNDNGAIILDDTIPRTEASGTVLAKDVIAYWKSVSYPDVLKYDPVNNSNYYLFSHFSGYPEVNGDVWKSVARLRMNAAGLKICSLLNGGCTIIKKGNQELMQKIPEEQINWQWFVANRDKILNPVTLENI